MMVLTTCLAMIRRHLVVTFENMFTIGENLSFCNIPEGLRGSVDAMRASSKAVLSSEEGRRINSIV